MGQFRPRKLIEWRRRSERTAAKRKVILRTVSLAVMVGEYDDEDDICRDMQIGHGLLPFGATTAESDKRFDEVYDSNCENCSLRPHECVMWTRHR